ncbi:NAD(P)-binding Rossmann-fold superfamily protein [Wolffia australiana]
MLQLRRQPLPSHGGAAPPPPAMAADLPLVVSLNCLHDTSLESQALAGLALVEHVSLARLAEARTESAAAVLVQSLAFLPRAAQRRLRPWQLVVCLGSSDRAGDSALAADLGLRIVHVDANRAEEVADTVMALFLGLLRRTHLLSRHVSSSAAASGWLGSIQPLCRGMRRCRGLVLGIIGRSASARCLATRSLAFRMSVLYFDVQEGEEIPVRPAIIFPRAARRMDTLNDLLAASDLVSLHCALTDETVHILNEECLQHIKPGAFIVNTGSSQLIDDCALKQLLIDGTVAGCALDGAEGPQWMEAWVREMPNVLILPKSADYSEEVWMEIREKAISILHSFFSDGIIPEDDISDAEAEQSEVMDGEGEPETWPKTGEVQSQPTHRPRDPNPQSRESNWGENSRNRVEARRGRSGKKGKKRPARRQSKQKSEEFSAAGDSHSASVLEGRGSSDSEDGKNKQICLADQGSEAVSVGKSASAEDLREGHVVVIGPKGRAGLFAARWRQPGVDSAVEVMTSVTRRDPAAQFLVTLTGKGLGLRSFTAGGQLLQMNSKGELVFGSHSLGSRERWVLEGTTLDDCQLINAVNSQVPLEVRIEVVAVVDEDGVSRWLD